MNGYSNLGCRCDRCRDAKRVNHQAYILRVREAGRILGRHGSEVAYDTGCRCDACRVAHNLKSREYKRSRRTATSTDEDWPSAASG